MYPGAPGTAAAHSGLNSTNGLRGHKGGRHLTQEGAEGGALKHGELRSQRSP